MPLPIINFLHFMVSEILSGQNFKGQGHYGKVKGQIKVTPWRRTPTAPNQCPYQVSTSYTLRFPKYSPNKILSVKVTKAGSKVKSRSCHDGAHLHPLTNVPTKYQLPTPYSFQDIARTRFYRSRTLWQGERSNQGYIMTLHTYNPKPMSLPSINFLHLTVSEI